MFSSPEFIPVAGPWITDLEVDYVADAARNAWYQDHHRYNARFEALIADYVGVRHAVSLPHATSALHLALAAAGVKAGDEVIVPDVTWIASTAPVTYVGASPVFVDILADTWCIDPAAVERAITPRTKAIIGVDLYGSMCDWARLNEIATRYGLVLIEDAAEALGSKYAGRAAGAFGVAAAFSFHGSKTVVTGEGGMLVTDDDDLHARVTILRDHGRPPGDRRFRNSEIAFKYKMSAVQAAIGVAQMERIEELIDRKRAIFRWYSERLTAINGIVLNAEPAGTVNSYWMVTIILEEDFGIDKFEFQSALQERNIDTRPFFSRLSMLEAYRDYPESRRFLPDRPVGDRPATYGVNLPSGYHMSEEKVEIVAMAVRDTLGL